MAYAVNKVILVGNIGSDLELKYTTGGDAVLNFSLATSERFKKKGSEEWTEKTEWHKLVVWRKAAEIIAENAHKGSKLYIEGGLQTRKWEKDGHANYTTEINIREFIILDPKDTSSMDGGNFPGRAKKEESSGESSPFADDDPMPWEK